MWIVNEMDLESNDSNKTNMKLHEQLNDKWHFVQP